ncbi:MAG: PAS domain S-box protein, partial [Flavobacteriaceae bacterium]|nr:PAS domain S-box protein [Flavobacteriaceae bacterium]
MAAIITVLAGLLVLMGWQLGNEQLKTFGFLGVSMKANTAISFLFTGLALFFLQQDKNQIHIVIARFFSLVTLLIGTLVLSQYLFNINLDIDELLFRDVNNANVNPGRMYPNSALNFVLLGCTLLLISFQKTKNWTIVVFFITVICCISALGLFGNLLGLTEMTGLPSYTKMTIYTSTIFIILILGILFTLYKDPKMILTLERKLVAGITATLIIIIFGSTTANTSIKSLVSESQRIERSGLIKIEINNTIKEIYKIIANVRGFIISNNDSFIENRKQYKINIDQSIKHIEALTQDNPIQQASLITLKQLVKERIDFSELLIITHKTKGQNAAREILETHKGEEINNKISAVVNAMIQEENRLLDIRKQDELLKATDAKKIINIGIIVQLILLLLFFVFVTSDISGKRKAQRELLNLNEELEEIVEERTAELVQNEARLLKAQQIAHLGFLDWNLKTNEIICSDECYQLYGIVKEGEFISFEKISKGVHPDDLEYVQKNLEFAVRGEKKYNIDHRIVKPDGTLIWVNAQAELILDENGNPKTLLGTILDITNRKLADEKLRESEEQFRFTLDNMMESFQIIDRDWKYIYLNKAAEKQNRRSKEQLLGKIFMEKWPGIETTEVYKLMKLCMDSMITQQKEIEFTFADGTKEWFDISVEPSTQGIFIRSTDITKRKKAENRKFQQTQMLESIIAGLPLSTILESIVKLVEIEDPTTLCSILLMDDEGKHLLNGAAPSLPEFYNQAIDGIEIGEKVGSCGAAAYLKKRVVAEDLLTHPNWAAYTELTQQANLRACWSEPILDAENNVLGTFAIYHRQPQAPQSEEIELLKSVVSLASLAISRKRNEEKIRNINTELELKVEERTKQLAVTNENLQQEMHEHKKTEDRIRLIVESVPNAIILVDANGHIQLVNTQAEIYFGYNRDELIGNKIEMLVPDAAKMGHVNLRTHFIHQPSVHKMGIGRDLFGLKKDGAIFPIEVSLNPIIIQNETLILTSIIDITERRKNEIELIKFKTALDSSADSIFIIDYEKNLFIDANNTALKNLGYTKEELLQMAPNDIKPLITKDELKKIFDKIIHSQSKLDKIETVHRRKNGTDFEVEVFIRAFRFDNSDLLIASVREITERKIAEEAIKNAKTEAERANIAKSEFLSRMSHELRTPLNSILGFTQLMSMGELNPAHQKGVDHIMKSGKHLLNLINEVLDLSRIEAGELSISLEPVQLNSIILETLDVIYPMAQEKSIKIEFKNQKMDNFFVKSDHQKLKQVLLNLVNNAVKFNKDSGLVTIKAEKYKNEKIRISIIDTGKGIAPEEIPKLFNPFQRIGSEISVIEGTGLGLAVSKKLMEAMHGSIGVESEIDKGSTFWIEFSQAECQNGHQERMGSFITNESDDITISGTLLYIEDNISNQQLVKQIMDTQRPSVNLITNMYGKNTLK